MTNILHLVKNIKAQTTANVLSLYLQHLQSNKVITICTKALYKANILRLQKTVKYVK